MASRGGAAWPLVVALGLLVVCRAAEQPLRRGSRRLRAVEADLATDPADAPMFQLATACAPHMKLDSTLRQLYKGDGFDVVDLTASIELTLQPTYANNFRDDDPTTWAPGDTRLNYTVEISPHGAKLPGTLVARLHTGSCFSELDADTVYLQNPNSSKSDVEVDLTVDAAKHTGSASVVKDYLVDYDETQAFVVYDGSTKVACCDLIPPIPDFPTEWQATVEANIVNQGYTYVQKETYSQTQNKVRVDLHSYDSDIVMVQDYSAKKTTIVYPPNSTYHYGLCQVRDFIASMGNFVDDDKSSVYDTSNFLMFSGSSEVDTPVFEPGHVDIRGIPCEAWYRNIVSQETNSSFDVSFFLPVNQWLVAREDYHRMLKQISVTGTIDGEEVEHIYSYINFRPYIAPANAFDVCKIAPKGENCGCDGKTPSPTPDTEKQVTFGPDGASVSVSSVPVPPAADACPDTDKFSDAQKIWYGIWAVVGFVVGLSLAWLGTVIWYRSVVGVRGGDRMGHSKMRERPFIIGRQQSHSASSYI